MVRSTYEEEEDDDEDDEGTSDEDAEVGKDSNRMRMFEDDARSIDEKDADLDDDFDYSLNKMSITPKNPPSYWLRDSVEMPSRIRPSTSPESL